MFINWILKLLAAFNSNKRPGELAAGFSFGILLALVPAGNLLWIAVFVIGFFTKLNLAVALVTLAIGKIAVPLADPVSHSIGSWFLNIEALEPVFTKLYNMPLVPLTDFNNTVVAGGFLAGLVLFIPCWVLFRILVNLFRNKLREKVKNSKLFKALAKSPVFAKLGGAALRINKIRSGKV